MSDNGELEGEKAGNRASCVTSLIKSARPCLPRRASRQFLPTKIPLFVVFLQSSCSGFDPKCLLDTFPSTLYDRTVSSKSSLNLLIKLATMKIPRYFPKVKKKSHFFSCRFINTTRIEAYNQFLPAKILLFFVVFCSS